MTAHFGVHQTIVEQNTPLTITKVVFTRVHSFLSLRTRPLLTGTGVRANRWLPAGGDVRPC